MNDDDMAEIKVALTRCADALRLLALCKAMKYVKQNDQEEVQAAIRANLSLFMEEWA